MGDKNVRLKKSSRRSQRNQPAAEAQLSAAGSMKKRISGASVVSPTTSPRKTGGGGSARRSKRRTYAVDPNNPLQIIRPNTDVKNQFGLDAKELAEFKATLNEDSTADPFSVRFGDVSPGPVAPQNVQTVFTPRVSAALLCDSGQDVDVSKSRNREGGSYGRTKEPQSTPVPNRARAASGVEQFTHRPPLLSSCQDQKTPSQKRRCTPPDFELVKQGSKYVEYDMDSSDEEFLNVTLPSSLNQVKRKGTKKASNKIPPVHTPKITAALFEKMISILERELEVAKLFLKERIRSELQGLVTQNLIDDGYASLILVNQFLSPSSFKSKAKAKRAAAPGPTSTRSRAFAALGEAYEHSRGEEACLSRRASTSSIVSAAVSAAYAAASGDEHAPNRMNDLLSTLSCPAPLALLLSSVPRNSPRAITQTSAEAAAVFSSTVQRSASQSSLASASSSASHGSSPRNSLRHEDTQTNSQYFTSEHLRELVPEERVILVLARVFRFNDGCCSSGEAGGWPSRLSSMKKQPTDDDLLQSHSATIIPPTYEGSEVLGEEQQKGQGQGLDDRVRQLLQAVYCYWVEKRSGHLDSLLRCYHNFMMDEWHQAPSMPPLPEDFSLQQLRRGHRELHRLRSDLDRARLIVDRVRRRERIKKDLVKLSSDQFDKVLLLVKQTATPSKPTSTLKTKGPRRGSKTEIDRCKVLSTLPSMLKKRPFSLHPEGKKTSRKDESEEEGEVGYEAEAHEPVRMPKGGGTPSKRRRRGDCMVVSTGRSPPSLCTAPTGADHVDTIPSLVQPSMADDDGPPCTRRRSNTDMSLIQRSSGGSSDVRNDGHSAHSTVDSKSNTCVPNGRRLSRGSLSPIPMVSIPKLKGKVRMRSQKWSSLTPSKAPISPERGKSSDQKRKLRSGAGSVVHGTTSTDAQRSLGRSHARVTSRKGAARTRSVISSENFSCSDGDLSKAEGQEGSGGDASSVDTEKSEERNSPPRARSRMSAAKSIFSDNKIRDSGSDSFRVAEIGKSLRNNHRFVTAPKKTREAMQSPVRRRLRCTPQRQATQHVAQESEGVSGRASGDSGSGQVEGRCDTSISDSCSDGDSYSESESESDDWSNTGSSESEELHAPQTRSRAGRGGRKRAHEQNTRAVTGEAAASKAGSTRSSSSGGRGGVLVMAGDPSEGYGNRAAKRGTYSPALCSLSGLARPFMSRLSSYKAFFS